VTVGQEAFLYLKDFEASVGAGISTLRVVHVNARGSIADPRPLRFEGLDSAVPLSFVDLHYDERAGFYGAFVLGRTFASHDSYLCRSENGIDWTYSCMISTTS
jgi:hypothetical protein